LRANRSYVFFAIETDLRDGDGPIGGAGVSLSPLRSIAVDRSLWSYGLLFWLNGNLPWEKDEATPFKRLMIAQDTGSAIVGPARADIFFGSGGRRARAPAKSGINAMSSSCCGAAKRILTGEPYERTSGARAPSFR
jgi:membrane-bound lytic murein transglycosylase A